MFYQYQMKFKLIYLPLDPLKWMGAVTEEGPLIQFMVMFELSIIILWPLRLLLSIKWQKAQEESKRLKIPQFSPYFKF